MTKSQSNQVFNTSADQNKQENANAQSSYTSAQTDIGNYQDQLAQYSAQNPFVQGGQYQTSQNQALADTAAAGSQAAAQAIESSGVRSGQNPAAGIAAAEQVSEANARNQSADVDQANQARMQGLANYGNTVLNASAKPAEMEAQLTQGENSAADSALGDETSASKTPSFWQELGQGVISAGGAFAGGLGQGVGKNIGCWIAARLYGGWDDRRTVLTRLWLTFAFSRSWHGRLLVAAYARWGERAADVWMPQSKLLTWTMRKVFARALTAAETWLATRDGSRSYGAYYQLTARYRQEWFKTPKQFSDRAIEFTQAVVYGEVR